MRFAGISVEPDYPGLKALARLAEAGQLKVHVARTFPLAQAAEAGPSGKVVLIP
jgi:NADPH:quinone reductase-like Zn-dependent oxidoreductase